MSEKRNRISLAQKLDIIEASKKRGFEDVMKKYGFFSLEKTDLVNLCGLNVRNLLSKLKDFLVKMSLSFPYLKQLFIILFSGTSTC